MAVAPGSGLESLHLALNKSFLMWVYFILRICQHSQPWTELWSPQLHLLLLGLCRLNLVELLWAPWDKGFHLLYAGSGIKLMETCFWLLFLISWAQLGLINQQNMGRQSIGKEEDHDAPIQFLLYGNDGMNNQQSFAIEFRTLKENVETLFMQCIAYAIHFPSSVWSRTQIDMISIWPAKL